MGRQAGKASAYARTILAVRAPYWREPLYDPFERDAFQFRVVPVGVPFVERRAEQQRDVRARRAVFPLEEDTLRDVYAVGHGSESASGARVFGRHPLPRPVRQFQVLFPGNRLERVDLRGIQPGFVQDGIAQPFGIVGIVGFYGIAA